MHRPHQDSVLQRCEAQIKRGEEEGVFFGLHGLLPVDNRE
jgi:hypothetical protein